MSTSTIKSRFRPRYEAKKHSKLCTVQVSINLLYFLLKSNLIKLLKWTKISFFKYFVPLEHDPKTI